MLSVIMAKEVGHILPVGFSTTTAAVAADAAVTANMIEIIVFTATYIIRDNWTTPSQVREALADLYKSDSCLEGIVLVGDVPVAMVRNAQHMTTAFKMDEENYPFIDSSVPSDRFYDCLDLEFRYLHQDEENPHLHYYELKEDCSQRLEPTFYSARIRYPRMRGGDKYEGIAAFLDKAAAAKTDMAVNRVDRVVSFNGHGYNGDCLIAWMDEEKAYKEHFPEAFTSATGFKHWNFRMLEPMKHRIFSELERPGIDLFMFHEHGAPTTQYINGFGETDKFDDRVRHFRQDIYSRVRRAISRGNSRDEVIDAFAKEFNLTSMFFADFDNSDLTARDSSEVAAKDIYADEFHDRVTMPRMVMFDACYNGSFHEDDYIAGEYIFNPGATVVTQGNTRNVLQDRWTIEMIGLLSHGVRAGQYNRLVATLEGHMIGDPTMHFAPLQPNTLSSDMTLHRDDEAYWESLLESPYADVRSLALRMLSHLVPESSFSPRLLEVFRSSPFCTTRMEALKLLGVYSNDEFREAVRMGINDPYERIARMSADLAGEIGDLSLLPAVVAAYIDGRERQRVNYTLSNSLALFPREDVMRCIDNYYVMNPRYNSEEEKKAVIDGLARTFEFAEDYNKRIVDKSLDDRKRISAIRFVRNNPYHFNIDSYLAVISDDGNSDAVRVNMAEALGWFRYSSRKGEIIDYCRRMVDDTSLPPVLSAELVQTAGRLQ